jgi:AcrR family transcriptional regulator
MPRRVRLAPRRRRSASEAREEILAAAERRLLAGGPDALRLKQIAAEAGVSHPLILHHFRSREGLIEALVDRALARSGREFLGVLATPEGATILEGIESAWRILDRGRYARVLAWLVLSGHAPLRGVDMKGFAEALHGARARTDAARGRPSSTLDDTRFAIALMTVALFGDALVGRAVRRRLGLPGNAAGDRDFRVSLANLLEHARDGITKRWT